MSAFQGKSVLVLGGSRGIGAAIVRRFAADGANVVFTYNGSREAAETLAAETGTSAVPTDSADRDAVIARVRESGALDILVVNAGYAISATRWNRIPTPSTGCSALTSTRPTMRRSRRRGTCPTAGGSS